MGSRRVRMPSTPPWRSGDQPDPEPSAPARPGNAGGTPWWLPVVVAAVVAGIVAGGLAWWIARPEPVADELLAVGDCANGIPFDGSDVAAVTRVDCSRLHDVEVYATTVVRGDGPWPGDIEVETRAARACRSAATGELTALDPGWQLKFLRPTPEGWALGDRGVVCLVARTSGSRTAGSVTR